MSPLSQTSPASHNPAFSPDGRWELFLSRRHASVDIYRVKVDGTHLERLTHDVSSQLHLPRYIALFVRTRRYIRLANHSAAVLSVRSRD
jgi:6-phosphogluconolactonase (cycloisomerase 2 family)